MELIGQGLLTGGAVIGDQQHIGVAFPKSILNRRRIRAELGVRSEHMPCAIVVAVGGRCQVGRHNHYGEDRGHREHHPADNPAKF